MAGLLRHSGKPRVPQLNQAQGSSDLAADRYSPYYAAPAPPPAPSYVSSASPMLSVNMVPFVTPVQRSAVVSRRPRLDGLRYLYVHGGVKQRKGMPHAGPADGMVEISQFQDDMVNLTSCQFNDKWYIAYPRNLGWSFRVSQLQTRVSGGPGPVGMAMRPHPRFGSVVMVPRYDASPRQVDAKPMNG